jgi:hypothetical protein
VNLRKTPSPKNYFYDIDAIGIRSKWNRCPRLVKWAGNRPANAHAKHHKFPVSRPNTMPLVANDGRIYINLRYGTRVIEITEGKSAIEVGKKKQLVPVTEALKQAVAAGDVDQHLLSTGEDIGRRFTRVAKSQVQKLTSPSHLPFI